jgi:hypothetical protein
MAAPTSFCMTQPQELALGTSAVLVVATLARLFWRLVTGSRMCCPPHENDNRIKVVGVVEAAVRAPGAKTG